MKEKYNHLIWLGAGTATEPKGVLNSSEHITLIEAREAACNTLRQMLPCNKMSVIQSVLTPANTPITFTEYNLAEFSAVHAATGLKHLYPGIKATLSEQRQGTAVEEAITALNLNDNNNLLIIDIADIGLSLLRALEKSGQLRGFSAIYIQGTREPLYANATTSLDITGFLHEQGYLLEQTIEHDPEMPWLHFGLNPLWETLQQVRAANRRLEQTLDELQKEKQLIHAAKQDVDQQLMAIQQQLEAAQQKATAATKNIEMQKDAENLESSKLNLLPNPESAHSKMLVNCDEFTESLINRIDESVSKHADRILLDIGTKIDESLIDFTPEDLIKVLPDFKKTISQPLNKIYSASNQDGGQEPLTEKAADISQHNEQTLHFNKPSNDLCSIGSNQLDNSLISIVLRFADDSNKNSKFHATLNSKNILISNISIDSSLNSDFKVISSEIIKFQFESFDYNYYDMTPVSRFFDESSIKSGKLIVVLEKNELLYDWRVFASVIEKIRIEYTAFSCFFVLNGLDESEINKLSRCI